MRLRCRSARSLAIGPQTVGRGVPAQIDTAIEEKEGEEGSSGKERLDDFLYVASCVCLSLRDILYCSLFILRETLLSANLNTVLRLRKGFRQQQLASEIQVQVCWVRYQFAATNYHQAQTRSRTTSYYQVQRDSTRRRLIIYSPTCRYTPSAH